MASYVRPPAARLIRAMPTPTCLVDRDGRVLAANREARRVFGLTRRRRIVGRALAPLTANRAGVEAFLSALCGRASADVMFTELTVASSADGPRRRVGCSGRNLLRDPYFGGLVLSLSPLGDAGGGRVDVLTGLANRGEWTAALTDAVARDGDFAVVMIDLDRFKEVNDTLGHTAGDELLVAVADRLREAVRGDDLIARLGGDEFVVLLPLAAPDEWRGVAERCMAVFADTFELTASHARRTLGASFGVATTYQTRDAAELLQYADVAMYQAKQRGRGRICAWDASLAQWIVERRADLDRVEHRYQRLREEHAELKDAFRHHEVTRLPNRRAFDEMLPAIDSDARATNRPYCVAFFDIDNFGIYNKRHGAHVGDRVLAAVGRALTTSARADDLTFHRSGEEFIAILTDCDMPDAVRVAGRMLDAIAALGEPDVPDGVTASAGIARLDAKRDVDHHAVVERADEAMRLAKSRGRNRVVLAR